LVSDLVERDELEIAILSANEAWQEEIEAVKYTKFKALFFDQEVFLSFVCMNV